MIHQVEKPVYRSKLRRMLGKEFYIAKRRLAWLFSRTRFSKVDCSVNYSNVWIDHKSILLRKLKDVDMHLQYNKITNLKLAVAKLDGVVIKPGETFSVWRLVGRPCKRKGYKEGMMILNGKVGSGIGGGLCQLGNLNGRITCETPLYSKYEVYETDHRFELQWWGGYTRHNCIWKRVTNLSTGEETTELITENNAIMMYNPMLER